MNILLAILTLIAFLLINIALHVVLCNIELKIIKLAFLAKIKDITYFINLGVYNMPYYKRLWYNIVEFRSFIASHFHILYAYCIYGHLPLALRIYTALYCLLIYTVNRHKIRTIVELLTVLINEPLYFKILPLLGTCSILLALIISVIYYTIGIYALLKHWDILSKNAKLIYNLKESVLYIRLIYVFLLLSITSYAVYYSITVLIDVMLVVY